MFQNEHSYVSKILKYFKVIFWFFNVFWGFTNFETFKLLWSIVLGRSLVDVPVKWPQMKTTETNRKFIETDWNELYKSQNDFRPMATLLKKNSKLNKK